MSEFDLEIDMPENYRLLLLKIIRLSKEQKTLSFERQNTFDNIEVIVGGSPIFSVLDEYTTGDVFRALNCIGLLETSDNDIDYTLKHADNPPRPWRFIYYLTPKAFRWYEYQNMGRARQFFAKAWFSVKDIMLGTAFILALILTLLQILQLVGIIK